LGQQKYWKDHEGTQAGSCNGFASADLLNAETQGWFKNAKACGFAYLSFFA
jgi:hypothetical protein